MQRDTTEFQQTVWNYYRSAGRKMPWRVPEPDGSFNPYTIMVSEVMLQQTQVVRVIPKFNQFMTQFPTVDALSAASLQEVLACWSGLGYNRRGKYVQEAARGIETRYGGVFPETVEALTSLPGIGHNTAAAICVYAFNQPQVFVETNIRTVYIHHFFQDRSHIDDKHILDKVAATLDIHNPREWYWALMDYGAFLKTTVGNTSRASKHYTVQKPFKGSLRAVRGAVIRELSLGPKVRSKLERQINDERFDDVIAALMRDGLVREAGQTLTIA